ncbi:MAG: ABC transporter permease [Thermoleophilia bacterium]
MGSRKTFSSSWEPAQSHGTPRTGILRRLLKSRTAIVSLTLAVSIALIALTVPLLPLQDPLLPDYDQMMQAPSSGHLLGTDLHGRDQLSRLLWASRTSLLVGIVATFLAVSAGVVIGGIAGYSISFIDSLLMRISDIFLSFPAILGAIAIMAIFGPGRQNIFFAIALFTWPVFARLFRSTILSVKERTFVQAARVLGASNMRIFLRHVMPNSAGPLVAYTSMAVAGAILAEAGLSFINLGVQRPNPSWGMMLAESMGQFEQAPWLILVPGIAVTMTALAFILLGVAVSSVIDGRNERAYL